MNLLSMKRLSLSGPVCMLSRARLRAIAWTIARQAPLSMGSSGQECWSGLLRLLQGIFLTQGSNLRLLHCRRDLFGPGSASPV